MAIACAPSLLVGRVRTVGRPAPEPLAAGTLLAPPVASRSVTAPIIPGAEPLSAAGGADGVLVLHGFTGNPQSMRPLAEALADGGSHRRAAAAARARHRGRGHGPDPVGGLVGAAEAAYRALAARCDARRGRRAVDGWHARLLAGRAPSRDRRHRRGQPAASNRPTPDASAVRALLDAGDRGRTGHRLGHRQAGRRSSPPTRARRSRRCSRCSTASARSRPASGRVRCPVLLFSSREDHVVDPVSGDRPGGAGRGPVERVLAGAQLPRRHPRLRRAEIEQRMVAFARVGVLTRRVVRDGRPPDGRPPGRLTRDGGGPRGRASPAWS